MLHCVRMAKLGTDVRRLPGFLVQPKHFNESSWEAMSPPFTSQDGLVLPMRVVSMLEQVLYHLSKRHRTCLPRGTLGRSGTHTICSTWAPASGRVWYDSSPWL